jgi:hypothetical protein
VFDDISDFSELVSLNEFREKFKLIDPF